MLLSVYYNEELRHGERFSDLPKAIQLVNSGAAFELSSLTLTKDVEHSCNDICQSYCIIISVQCLEQLVRFRVLQSMAQ